MKKRMILFIFILLFGVILVGCSNNSDENGPSGDTNGNTSGEINDNNDKPKTPIQELTEEEYIIFLGLLEFIQDGGFYNPQDVKLVGISVAFDAFKEGSEYEGMANVVAKISGTNKLGGTITKVYYLLIENDGNLYYYFDSITGGFDTPKPSDDRYMNFQKLNKAIAHFWEEGLD